MSRVDVCPGVSARGAMEHEKCQGYGEGINYCMQAGDRNTFSTESEDVFEKTNDREQNKGREGWGAHCRIFFLMLRLDILREDRCSLQFQGEWGGPPVTRTVSIATCCDTSAGSSSY